METNTSERRFALLIDADNVSAKYLKPILDELSKYGTVTYKRIYGDWTLNLHAKWKEALLKNSITPIQQFGYTQGKNATDSAMIIDAMDILYANSVEGFCIVSSDSDFTRLAVRLRESGRMVIGMGEKKTPIPFRTACDVFTTLELLMPETNSRSRRGRRNKSDDLESVQEATATRAQIEQAVIDIISDNINNGKATGLGEVGSRLLKIYPDFDTRSYGMSQISKLLDSFASVVVRKEGYNVAVELAEGVEPGTVLDQGDSSTDDSAETDSSAPSTEQAEEKAEGTSDEETSTRRRRRRGGRSRHKADATKEERDSSEASEDEPEDTSDKAAKTTEAPASNAEGTDVKAPEETARDAQEADGTVTEPKPKRPSRRRKKPATEAAATDAPASTDAPEEEEPVKPEPKPKRATRKKTAPQPPAEQPAQDDAITQPAAKEAAEDVADKVNDYITNKLRAAGKEGVAVGRLGRTVRSKFRSFKLRERGFQNLRAYLATIEGVSIEKREEDYFAFMD